MPGLYEMHGKALCKSQLYKEDLSYGWGNWH